MNTPSFLIAALAAALWAAPAASQDAGSAGASRGEPAPATVPSERHPPPRPASAAAIQGGVMPRALRPDAPAATGSGVELPPIRLDEYTYWGLGVGGATGLAYSLASGHSPDSLERVLTVVVGAGVGMYIGAAIDIVRSLGAPED